MKSISTALKAHYAQRTTTLATCWRAILTNDTVVAVTSADHNIPFGGVTYLSSGGYSATDVASTAELSPDNLEIEGFLASPAITDMDIHSGVWDYAEIEIFEVNYADLTMGKNVLRSGTLGEVKGGRSKFTAELRGLMQAYVTTIGRITTKDCTTNVGSALCKVVMTPFTVTGTVGSADSKNQTIFDAGRTEPGPAGAKAITGISRAFPAVVSCPGHGLVTNAAVLLTDIVGVTLSGATGSDGVFINGSGDGINGRLFTATVLTADSFSINVDTRAYNADSTLGVTVPSQVYSPYISGGMMHPANATGYFDYGLMTFTSGLNSGLSMEVKAYAPGSITLKMGMPFLVAPGDTYTMTAGCDRSYETCKTRYNNVINFRGFPNIPQAAIYKRGGE
jgi:hypothetical protein